METSLASSDDLRFSAAFHVVYHLGLGILCFIFVAHALRGYARSVETLNEQLCEFKAAGTSSSCCDQGHGAESDTTVCDRAILFQCIAHWYGSLDKFESQVQSKVRGGPHRPACEQSYILSTLVITFYTICLESALSTQQAMEAITSGR